MMRYLLDTHTLLWYLDGNEKLSRKSYDIIVDPHNQVLVSVASLFEIAIKVKLGKLYLENSISQLASDLVQREIVLINILDVHLTQYQQIPLIENHRDPFDRLIIATGVVENASIVSVDQKFSYYSNIVNIIH